MPIIHAPKSPTHHMETTRFWQLAAPSTGSSEASVWRVEVQPDTDPTPHELTREEILVVVDGTAQVMLDGTRHDVAPGDAIVVPPHTPFSLAATGTQPLVALAFLPVGGQAQIGTGEPFTPPWAQ